MQAVVCEGKGTDMDGYTLSISRCSGGDGVEGIMDDVFRLEYGSCEFKI